MSSIDDLSKLVKEVLHIEEIENNVNLFDYGMHSLNVIQIIHLIHEEFATKIELPDMFEAPTIDAIYNKIVEGKVNVN